jgi:hypothetical protein
MIKKGYSDSTLQFEVYTNLSIFLTTTLFFLIKKNSILKSNYTFEYVFFITLS